MRMKVEALQNGMQVVTKVNTDVASLVTKCSWRDGQEHAKPITGYEVTEICSIQDCRGSSDDMYSKGMCMNKGDLTFQGW